MINDIFFYNTNGDLILRVPFVPSEIFENSPQENIIVNLYKYGDTPVDTREGLSTLTWDSFFSDDESLTERRDTGKRALEYIQIIENIKKSKKPFKLIIAGTTIGTTSDFYAIINDFQKSTNPNGDISYTISLLEARRF